MPKIILRCNYLKDEPPEHLVNYVRYIATREGVEKIDPGKAHLPATVRQKQLIRQIVKDIEGSERMLEYEDYRANPTRENASEFISIALENNLDLIAKRKNYVDYIANRPRVERINEHGLFTDEGVPVILSEVADAVANHKGVIWTHVISLRREDAERLGYNCAAQWMSLLRKKKDMLCKNMRIDVSNLKWYAAFHNESHHPHVHLFIYSKNETEGFLTNNGIENMRSDLAHTIFRQDFAQIYERQNEARGQLKESAEAVMEKMIREIETGVFENKEIEEKILLLADRLRHINGKKQYGYLNADIKAIVDGIVDTLAEDEHVSWLYSKWLETQNEILNTYQDQAPQAPPLSQQSAFQSVKNMVIREAVNIGEHRMTFEPDNDGEESEQSRPEPDSPSDENEYQVIDLPASDELSAVPLQDQENTVPSRLDCRVEWSEQYKKAREYLYGSSDVEQDFSKAYQLFHEEALSGNALAIYDLGRIYHDGLGVEIDEEIAQQWYSKALAAFTAVHSKKPKPYVQYRIGKMFAAGQGTEQDYIQAAAWFEQAVEKNHKFAQYSLAGLYYRGNGVVQDYTAAFSLYDKSAAQGNPYADYELAKMLRDGVGTQVNSEKAYEHFRLAFEGFVSLEHGGRDDKLEYRIGQMFYTGTGTQKDIDAAQKYFEQSAKLGNVHAEYMLAKIYLEAGSAENIQKAIDWLERAAENGNPTAQYALGKLYRDSDHVEKDIGKAVSLFTKAAEQKDQYAAYALGKLYLDGKELPQNNQLAIGWLSYASELGNPFAQYSLGKIYRNGILAEKNITKALELFVKSAEQKNQYPAYALGKLYLDGIDVEQDIPKAVDWLICSAKQKNQFAAYLLGKLYLDGNQVGKDVAAAIRWFTVSAEQENETVNHRMAAATSFPT